MAANQSAVVFLDDEYAPGAIENGLLEHGGPRALTAEYQDHPALISGGADDGAGHALRKCPRSAPEQWLVIPVSVPRSVHLRRRVKHQLGLSSPSSSQRTNNTAAGNATTADSLARGSQTIAAAVRGDLGCASHASADGHTVLPSRCRRAGAARPKPGACTGGSWPSGRRRHDRRGCPFRHDPRRVCLRAPHPDDRPACSPALRRLGPAPCNADRGSWFSERDRAAARRRPVRHRARSRLERRLGHRAGPSLWCTCGADPA